MTAIKDQSGITDSGFRAAAPVAARRSLVRRLAGGHPLAFTVAVVVAVIAILPFVTLIISALTPVSQMGADRWLPSSLRWANFADAVRYIPFWSMLKSSVLLSSLFAVLTTFSSALTGYGFARLRGPGKKMLFTLLIGTMMVPPIVTLIPTYLLFSDYHLVGTYWPWVLWGAAGTPYAIFLYRQYFSSFPKELEEAAVIDGAGQLRIFVRVFLPLSRPLLVTAFVLAFNMVWGDFIAPDLFLNQSNSTLAVGVASGYENSQGYPLYNLLAGGALLYVVPVILLFLFGAAQLRARLRHIGAEMSYRDPVYDGATDPVVVRSRDTGDWLMFYTQRRASAPGPGVAWVHGTDIGIAVSSGGGTWLYLGTVEGLDFERGRNTFWAPEIFWARGEYHMLVTYIRGVPDRWDGHERQIRHYASHDLLKWSDLGPLDLRSRYVIDAAVYQLPSGRHRLWFKDEARGSHTYTSDSPDLLTWSPPRPAITGDAHEGPNVFALGGWYWLITDEWRGLAVYRSADLETWQRKGMILDVHGTQPDDTDIGRHADVVECGDRAFIFYFTHPGLAGAPDPDSYQGRRSCVLAAELHVEDGHLTCDRNAPPAPPFLIRS